MRNLLSAFLWFESHLIRKYRWAVLSQIVQFLVFLLIFARLPIDSSGGDFGGMPYVQFVLTGLAYQIFYEGVMNGPVSRLNELQLTGQLQVILSAPFPRWMILLASGFGSSLAGASRALVVLIAGALIFSVPIQAINGLALAASLIYTLMLGLALALLNVAGALIWPRVNLTSFFSSLLLGLISGVFLPIDRLPAVLRPIALVNPLRFGLDVFRSAFGQHGPPRFEGWPPAVALLSLIVLIAVLAYRRADFLLTRDNRYQIF